MKNDKRKNDDNKTLFVVLGLLGVTAVGAFAWSRSGSSSGSTSGTGTNAGTDTGTSSSSSGSSSSGTSTKPSAPKPTPTKSLFDVAASLRAELLTIAGCSVSWRLGEPSRNALLTHQSDFFIPGIADARARGLSTTDEITSHLAGLLVPGCQWPPKLIKDFDIEAAVAGQLGMVQTQLWTVAQASGTVQLYLTIRQVVASRRTRG